MKIVVLDGHAVNPGDLSWAGYEKLGELAVYPRSNPEDVIARAQGADAVFTSKVSLRRESLEQLPTLRYIGVFGTGYDVIDIPAARERKIVVTNIPTYGTHTVAQFACALLMELCHHVGLHADSVTAGDWTRNPDWTFWRTPQMELAGKTLGIVGFGRIGRQFGSIANALGMKVIAHDSCQANAPPWDGFGFVSLPELLRESDVVSLHCPLSPDTRGMIDTETIGLMKSGAFLINTSRGPLINETDLAAALNAGRIAGAAVDVLSVEPPSADNPLLSAKNCIVTPHMAWSTSAARGNLFGTALANLQAFLAGRPQNVVS